MHYLTAKEAAELSNKQLGKASDRELQRIMVTIRKQVEESSYRGITWEHPNILAETKKALIDLGYKINRRTYTDENDDLLITW